jgi:hypothetical protein
LHEKQRSFNPSVLFNDDENVFEELTTGSVFVVCICTGAVHFFSSKKGNSGKLYMNN